MSAGDYLKDRFSLVEDLKLPRNLLIKFGLNDMSKTQLRTCHGVTELTPTASSPAMLISSGSGEGKCSHCQSISVLLNLWGTFQTPRISPQSMTSSKSGPNSGSLIASDCL